jgi:hypothetical protein
MKSIKQFIRLPKGKYNGREIIGFGVDFKFRGKPFWLKPIICWNHQYYICWLFFRIEVSLEYEY